MTFFFVQILEKKFCTNALGYFNCFKNNKKFRIQDGTHHIVTCTQDGTRRPNIFPSNLLCSRIDHSPS